MQLNNIKGVGPSIIKKLEKINIKNIIDLISYYPFRYEILEKSDIDSLENDSKIIIDGMIETIPNVFHFNRKMDKMSFKLNTGDNLLNIVIFNRGFLKQRLSIGTKITVIGKYDKLHNTVTASDIRFGLIPPKPIIEPIYHTINGLSSKQINNFISVALIEDYNVTCNIPSYLMEKYNLLDKKKCISIIHNPSDLNILNKALNTLKYEELFLFMLRMNSLKLNKKNKIGIKRDVGYENVDYLLS